MEISIGVTYTAKEISLELAEGSDAESIKNAVEATFSGSQDVLWLEDKKGRHVGIPADKIAYIELGSEDSNRPIGFS